MKKTILYIVLAMLWPVRNGFAQDIQAAVKPTISISGKVTDEKGEGLPGASVIVKDSKLAAVTDAEGRFMLTKVPADAVLIVSFIGYLRQEFAASAARSELTIILQPNSKQLEEVVISTGYQELSSERLTGSFVQLDSTLLNRRVSTNIINRIEDLVPGLIFNRNASTSLNTASSSAISIRGQGTILGRADPLIVIDNFPYDGSTDNINPNDVESITVLKDAAAASIWGARAGNGVIVITTKKGTYNRAPAISFNSNLTIGAKPNLFYQPQMSSAEFIEMEKLRFGRGLYQATENSTSRAALSPVVELLVAKRDGLIPATEADARIEALKNFDTRNDLNRYVYRNSLNQQYALDLNGGGENQRYYLSAGYDKNLSTHKGTGYDRITLSAKNSYSLLKQKLEITAGVYYTLSSAQPDFFDYNPRFDLSTSIPSYPYARLADGNGNPLPVIKDLRTGYASSAAQLGLLEWEYRPLEEIELRDHRQTTTDFRVNTRAAYQVSPNLKAEVLFLYNTTGNESRNLQSVQTFFTRNLINTFTQVSANGTLTNPIPVGDILDLEHSKTVNRNLRAQLSYDRSWAGKHHLDLLGGYEIKNLESLSNTSRSYGYDAEHSSMNAVSYLTPYKRYQSLTASTSTIPYIDSESNVFDRFRSFYAHGSYTFDQRFIVSASARLDQSNLFGVDANQKGVPLYSAGLGWNVHSEAFYNSSWLPYLKLRLSYGYNGNVYKNISALTTASYSTSYSASPNTALPYATITNPPNPELRWERIRVVNLGLDFNLRNSVVGGTVELYRKEGIDLIGNSPYDPTTGISAFKSNNSSTVGTGIDLTLNTRNIDRAFKWYSNLLLSYVHEKVTSYKVKAAGFNYPVITGLPLEGRPLFSIYSYPYAGLDPLTGDPQGYLNGVVSKNYSAISAATTLESLIYNGTSRPTLFGSLRNTISVNNISLSANIVYRTGYFFRKSTINYFSVLNGSNGHGDFSKRWQKPGDELITDVPSMPASANSRNDAIYLSSDLMALKGDHVRFQDINLSYSINRVQWQKMPFNYVQLYLYANNLGLLWTANKFHIDPDYQQTGPPPRTIALGVKIGL